MHPSLARRRFYEEQIAEAKEQGVLFSLHLKATMMKAGRTYGLVSKQVIQPICWGGFLL